MRLTAHCVGVCPEGLVLQRHGKGPVQWLCAQWSDLSAALCSPFYEHELELQESTQPNLYVVTQWHAVTLRIDEASQNFGRRARELLLQSFFPLLAPSQPYKDRECYFPWETRQKPLSVHYCEQFNLQSALRFQGPATQFWKQHQAQHAVTLKAALARLELSHVQSVEALYRALDSWPQAHQAPYVRHRLLEMDSLFTATCHNDWLQLPLATLSPGTVHDVARLHRHCQALSRGQTGARALQNYNNLPQLLRHTLRDRLPTLLRHYWGEPCNPNRRQLLLDRLLVPCLMTHFETQALADRSSCFPVTLKSLHWHYCSLLGLDSSDEGLRALLPFDAASVSKPVEGACFEPSHLSELLGRIRTACGQRPLHWQPVEQEELVQKPYCPLLLVHARPDELSRERHWRRVWMQPQWHRRLLLPPEAAQWDVAEWRAEQAQLDEVERQLWDARFVLLALSPADLKRGRDMALLDQLLSSDFCATSLIRPARSQWTYQRLLQRYHSHWADSISLRDLHERLHYVCDEQALRETLVVLDAHLYSNCEWQSLLDWLSESRGKFSHCVVLGAFDTHPAHAFGHAFLDAAQWCNRAAVRTQVFGGGLHSTQFQALLDACAASVFQLAALTQLQPLLSEWSAGASSLVLFVVVQCKSEHSWRANQAAKAMQQELEEHLSLKFTREACLQIRPVALDALHLMEPQHGCRYVCVVRKSFLQSLKRNELNQLLLLSETLLLVGSEARKLQSLDWLAKQVERQQFPNLRHTLPFMEQLEKRDQNHEFSSRESV